MASIAPSPSPSPVGASFALPSGPNPYAKGGQLFHLVDRVVQYNQWEARLAAHRLYSKIAGNVISHPADAKYRKLNISKVIGKFGTDFKGIAELLHQVGFRPDGVNLLLAETASTDALAQSLAAWDEREARSAAGRAEADRVRAENLSTVSAETARKNAIRAQQKSLGEQHRADVASKPIVASHGNQIKFGSTLVRAQAPKEEPKSG